MNIMRFVTFLSVVILVYFGMHYYVYSRIVRGFSITGQTALYLRIAFLLAGLSFFIGEISSRSSSMPFLKIFGILGAVWMGILSIAIFVFVINDIVNFFSSYAAFRHYSTIIAVALITILSSYSILNVLRKPLVKEITIYTEKLPANISNFTIVQLSDMHLNFFKTQSWLNSIIDETNKLNPDLVVITGDLVDADLTKPNGFSEALANIRSKYGVYAVTGNHEYYSGIERFLLMAQNSNINVLRNTKVLVGGAVELVGIDDRVFNEQEDSLKTALMSGGAFDRSKFSILLSHQPDIFDAARDSGIDLQLSGHTHAGQIPPMDLIVMLVYKYPFGLYRNGSSYLYTSPGTGIWGPPMRLSSRCEIVKITITK